jgi:phosphate starvation-inducible PhoH-like protein
VIRYGDKFPRDEPDKTRPFGISKESSMSKKRKTGNNSSGSIPVNFELRKISALTANQERVFQAYSEGNHLNLHGYAGTGKTYLALYLALRDYISSGKYRRVIVVRSVVPSRKIGFLPGDDKQKSKVYEDPYKEIVNDLFSRGDAYDCLKLRREVEFTTTSFLRGLTFYDSIIIVDEIQNMLFQELDTVMTRLGDNTRVIFCGDYRQSDLDRSEREGVHQFMNVLHKMQNFAHIEFGLEDIVRSGLVKDYIIHRTELNL